MAKTPEMSSDFAGWYTSCFMDEGSVRAARWKGVVDTAAASDYKTVEVLLRLAFGVGAPAGTKSESLDDHYRTVVDKISGDGTALESAGSQRELQVLAAAVLVRLFSSLPDAAIGVTTTSFNGARAPELPMDLAGLAQNALLELSRIKHNRAEAKELVVSAPKVDFEVSEQAIASFDQNTWKTELERLRDATRAATRFIIDGQNRIMRRLTRQIELGNEELQMLWWLVGEHSDIGKKFSKVDAALKPLTFAKELGRMTTASPGPASIISMLARAGIADRSIKVQDAVNAPALDWANSATTSQRISPVSTPLHFALEKRAEIGDDEAWQSVWSAMTGFTADASLSAIRMAELFYREHIYLHVEN